MITIYISSFGEIFKNIILLVGLMKCVVCYLSPYLTLVVLVLFCSVCVSAEQNFTQPSIDVYVNIPASQEWAEVQLNESNLDFGTLGVGNETHYRKVLLESRGNVNITITPVLKNASDDIFSNLFFTRRGPTTSSNYDSIGNWSIDMNRTYSVGDWNSDYFYIKLDLKDYTNDIPFDIMNHRNNVEFVIMPRYD